MLTRNTVVLSFGVLFVAVLAVGQSPIVLSPASISPLVEVRSPACAPGFAEIVATHFRVSRGPQAALLRKGTLKIAARRGFVEESGSTLIPYRDAEGAFVPEVYIPISDGALDRPACVPFTSIHVATPLRYQMTVTDDSAGAAVLLQVTADITQPQYRLDDPALFRTDDGAGVSTTVPVSAEFHECIHASWCGRE